MGIGMLLGDWHKRLGHMRLTEKLTGGFVALGLFSTSANAETLLERIQSGKGIALISLAGTITIIGWSVMTIRRLSKMEKRSRQRMRQMEIRLNEAEAAIDAEPGMLIIWRGRVAEPERIVGSFDTDILEDQSEEKVLQFAEWLSRESAESLKDALTDLRDYGAPFNIGITTDRGELLEADGRAAGGTATLRLRALVGDRRNHFDLNHEARRLGHQVERLSALIDLAPFPIWLCNENHQLVWVNSAYLHAVDATNMETVVENSIQLVNQEKLQLIEGARKNGHGLIGRGEVIMSGDRRSVDVFQVALQKDKAYFAVDMTALEKVQNELDLHIKAHASTLDNLTMAIAIFGPDQHLRYYNAAYAELWALDTDWLDTHPGDSEILDKLRTDRKLPEQANYRSWKKEVLSSYNRLEPVERWWHLPDGQSLRVVCEQHPFGGVTYVYENATAQIQLESRYNALISIHTETLNSLGEGIALFGTDGKLQLFNVSFSRIWNVPEEQLAQNPHIDKIIDQCFALYDDRSVWDDIKYCVTSLSDKRKPLNDRINRNDDKVFDCAAVPLPGGNTLVTFVDVTASSSVERALRERNEALETADRLKTNFLSNVSYELRTPLTNILGFSEGLAMGIAGDLGEKQREYLGHIEVSSNQLLAIIDAILDLTTIDAGAMELALEKIDVADLLEECARPLADRISTARLELKIEVGTGTDYLVGDRRRLNQVFKNLLSNAIGFAPPDSQVRFGAKTQGDNILIFVADNGKGMEPEFQKRAFERFQSMPISGGHRGPGLGLAIVKSFVELHDGEVTLASRPGKGTTVVCRLPKLGPEVTKPSDAGDTGAGPLIVSNDRQKHASAG